jgi:hypothetical protein
MTTALILLALLGWVIVCWAQYRYTTVRHQAEYERRKSRWTY